MKLCNFRPSRSISPKRELQSLVFGFSSRFSPRRPGTGSRGNLDILSATSHPSERFWDVERQVCSLRREWLA